MRFFGFGGDGDGKKGKGRPTTWYMMPFDGTDAPEASSQKLVLAKICTVALRKLMEVGDTRWKTIRNAAMTTGTVAPSKN